MHDTWIADFTHYLDENGNIISAPHEAKTLGEYFAAIILMASFPDSEYPAEFMVKCRRRPKRKPCLAKIIEFIDPETGDIVWTCPKCNDQGVIKNWRGTMWDMSDSEQFAH